MDYDDAIRWLRTLPDFERTGEFTDRPDLAPMRALLADLADPHLGRRTIHIAGSQPMTTRHPSHTYPGTSPGFAESDLDEYDKSAARLAWSRTLGMMPMFAVLDRPVK